MTPPEVPQFAEYVAAPPKPDGWISAPLPVLGNGPDAAHWSIRCADCDWWTQGYGLLDWAMEQLRDHRQTEHSDGTVSDG